MQPAECPPKETLRSYLAGLLAEEQSVALERHLVECEQCEQTATNLEADPDTIIENLRGIPVTQTHESTSAIDDLNLAKSLIDDGKQPFQFVASEMQASSHIGSYVISRRLGRGGMGSVYLARHQQLDKQVAIKLLPALSARNEEVLARFQREMRAVGKLDHPAIVRATDAGESSGHHFLVMEFIDGLDLSQVARATGALPIADAAEIARQAALGLSYAHAQGVVHRDIKPSNLILDANGHVKILDFGLAQISMWEEGSAELTTVGQLMGTLDYMAPEQAERGDAVDYRADLYALGATLFRLLSGRPPLAASPNLTPLEKLRLLSDHEPPRIETLRDDVPEQLSRLVNKLLSRNPSQRPPSAAHVAEQLSSFAADSNLEKLLSSAREAQHQDNALEPLRSLPKSGLKPSPTSTLVRSRTGGIGRIGLWTAALLFPFTLSAGILLILDTQKGQLVIESDVADVRVKLVADGKEVNDIQIHSSPQTTRLRSGKYEIVIDAPSDQYTISNQQFTIQNGQAIIARISSKPRDASETNKDRIEAVNVSNATATNEVMFEGKTLDTWLHELRFEVNYESVTKAATAVSRLVNDANADRIEAAALEVLRRSPDASVVSLLSQVSKGHFFQLYVKLLEESNRDLKLGLIGNLYFPINTKENEDIGRFLDWTDKTLRDSQQDKYLPIRVRDKLHSWVANPGMDRYFDKDVSRRIVEQLAKHSHWTGYDFWLQSFEPKANTGENVNWNREYRNEVLRQAGVVIADQEADPVLVAKAMMIATSTSTADSEALNRLVDESLPAFRKRIQSLIVNATNADQSYYISDSFSELTHQILRASDLRVPVSIGRGTGRAAFNPVVVMLNLIILAGKQQELKEELTALHNALPVQLLKDFYLANQSSAGRRGGGRGPRGSLGSLSSGLPSNVSGSSNQGPVISVGISLREILSLFVQTGVMIGKSEDEMSAELLPPQLDPKLIQPGDTLAIYVPGQIPAAAPDVPETIPVMQVGARPPVMGIPFPVSVDGEIFLPDFGKVKVEGKSINEATELVFQMYAMLFKTPPKVNVGFLLRAGESLAVRSIPGEATSPATQRGGRGSDPSASQSSGGGRGGRGSPAPASRRGG